MASASSLQFAVRFRSSSSSYLSNNNRLFVGFNIPLLLRYCPSSRSVLALSRRRRNNSSAVTPKSPAKRNKSLGRSEREDDDDIGEDAFEALFLQLEEDLKNDELSVTDDDDDISEEDLMSLERELEEAIGDDELLKVLDSAADGSSTEVDDVDNNDEEEEEYEDDDDDDEHDEFEDEYEDEDDDDDDEDERPVLKNWQLRRLAYALKQGRRKTNIKMLAAEICVDRAIVLEYLREPPPSLLMLSATLPDKPVQEISISEPVTEELETVPLETEVGDEAKRETKGKVPVHMMQNNWSAQKRLKKVHIETLERIYRRTKRPTNSMVSNIVHVTNLPRKRVVKWFEDRRAEESVPDNRIPYKQTPDSETVSNS